MLFLGEPAEEKKLRFRLLGIECRSDIRNSIGTMPANAGINVFRLDFIKNPRVHSKGTSFIFKNIDKSPKRPRSAEGDKLFWGSNRARRAGED